MPEEGRPITDGSPTVVFRIRPPLRPADLPGLCERICGLLGSSGSAIVGCDVAGIDADAVAVDALARLQLAARRRGCLILLRGADDDLRELLAFMGLRDVLPE